MDFDGTIKLPADYAIPVNKTHMSYGFGKFYDWCIKHRVTLVLWTCRNLSEEKELNYVYDFLSENGLEEIFIPIISFNIWLYSSTFNVLSFIIIKILYQKK